MTAGARGTRKARDASQALLDAALELARVAGAKALEHFGGPLEVEAKADGSPVTIADRGAERVARDWLERRFPDDGIVGEELGETRPDARRRWILDPIDGTQSFVRGVPLWGTLVAVAEGERVLAGAASFPATREWIAAAPGQGCWWNDARARVSATASLDRATVLVTDGWGDDAAMTAGWQRLGRRAARARTWGDAFGYLLVATGRAEAMLDLRMNVWDAAWLEPVIAEAGGVLTDWHGRPGAFGGNTVATNAALADAVRRTLAEGS